MSVPTDNYRCKQQYAAYSDARRQLNESILNQAIAIQGASLSHAASNPSRVNYVNIDINLVGIRNLNTQIQNDGHRLQVATQAVFQCLDRELK